MNIKVFKFIIKVVPPILVVIALAWVQQLNAWSWFWGLIMGIWMCAVDKAHEDIIRENETPQR